MSNSKKKQDAADVKRGNWKSALDMDGVGNENGKTKKIREVNQKLKHEKKRGEGLMEQRCPLKFRSKIEIPKTCWKRCSR